MYDNAAVENERMDLERLPNNEEADSRERRAGESSRRWNINKTQNAGSVMRELQMRMRRKASESARID